MMIRTLSAALLAAAIFLTGCATSTTFAALERHTVNADGHPIAVWEKSAPGAREAVLLVHGRTWSALPDFDLRAAGENVSLMDSLVEAGYAVYAIDQRGYGETPRDDTGWLTPNRAADDVAQVLNWIDAQHTHDRRPHLFGWSMGSSVSQLAVQRHPQAAASLTLYGYWRDDDMALPADPPGMQPERRVNTAKAAASDFILPDAITRNVIDAFVAAALAADPVRVDVRHTDQYNALEADRIQVPTLLIVGEHDPIAPLDRQTKLFARLNSSNKQLVVVAGGDHAVHLEAPRDTFVRQLVAFFQSVGAP